MTGFFCLAFVVVAVLATKALAAEGKKECFNWEAEYEEAKRECKNCTEKFKGNKDKIHACYDGYVDGNVGEEDKKEEENFDKKGYVAELLEDFTGDDATKEAMEKDMHEKCLKTVPKTEKDFHELEECEEEVIEKHCPEAKEHLDKFEKDPVLKGCEWDE